MFTEGLESCNNESQQAKVNHGVGFLEVWYNISANRVGNLAGLMVFSILRQKGRYLSIRKEAIDIFYSRTITSKMQPMSFITNFSVINKKS